MILAFVLVFIDLFVFIAILGVLWQSRTSQGGRATKIVLVRRTVCTNRNPTKGRLVMSENKTDMGKKMPSAVPVPSEGPEMPEQPLVPHVLVQPLAETN